MPSGLTTRSTALTLLLAHAAVAVPTARAQEGDASLAQHFTDIPNTLFVKGLGTGNAMGLAADEKRFLLLHQDADGSDRIVAIDRQSTAVLDVRQLGTTRSAAAIALHDDSLWVMSRSARGFLRRLDGSGKETARLDLANRPEGTVAGLVARKDAFFFAVVREDGRSSVLCRLSPETNELRELARVDGRVFSLAVHDGRLLAYFETPSDARGSRWLALFDAEAGSFVKLRFLQRRAWGLVSEGARLWALARSGPGAEMVPFAVQPERGLVFGDPLARQLRWTRTLQVTNDRPVHADIWMALPRTREFELVRNVRTEPPGDIVVDRYGNRLAHVAGRDIAGTLEHTLSFDVLSVSAAWTPDLQAPFDKASVPAEVLASSRAETFAFDYSSPRVQRALGDLTLSGGHWQQVLALQRFVNDALADRSAKGSEARASDFLAEGAGRCFGHTVVFAALARARGVPTRAAGGLPLALAHDRTSETLGDEELRSRIHTWNQVWLPRRGWVDVDTQADDTDAPSGPPERPGYHSRNFVTVFEGDYERADYRNVFTQRDWSAPVQWRSATPDKATVEAHRRMEIRRLDRW